jgi:hypothetical protein
MSEIQRGEIWWADLLEPQRSEPGYRRPVLPARSAGLAPRLGCEIGLTVLFAGRLPDEIGGMRCGAHFIKRPLSHLFSVGNSGSRPGGRC